MNVLAGALEGGNGDGGQGGGSPTPTPTPTPSPSGDGARWQDTLPDDLRNDETLGAYKSPEDAYKGLIETKRWARGRIALPNADDPNSFTEFASKVRPAKAEDYKIFGSDGEATEIGEAFRQEFFEVGLHPFQAERLSGKWNQFFTDQASRVQQQGKDELTAIEVEMGQAAYTQRTTAVANMLRGAGIDVADLALAMEQLGGPGKAMRALFALAEKTGELAKVDGATVRLNLGSMSKADAQAELDRMNADPEVRKAVLANTTGPEAKKREALMNRLKGKD
ncbi:hypothetical protein ACFQ15_05740 [Sphingomonas hankookensis]|uniref:hypothetical protein n=1 Tax=Sphingomonas hankookensis TaxID=563996 RepID=UPI001F590B2C|nr:hypothetical protein [Sphingomonas hankookensis]